MERAEIISTVRSLPDNVEPLIIGLSSEQLRWRASPDEWSIIEVCCHVRDAGEISTLRITRLATEDDPTIEGYDEQALARERDYLGDDIARVRPALRTAWSGLAETLERLPPEAWQRAGRHPERGALTLAIEAQRYAEHARTHLEQLRTLCQRMANGLADTRR